MMRCSFLILFTLCIGIVQGLHADSWRVFFYMDCSDGLCDMAIKNITDMMRITPNNNVEFFVQVHAYDDAALRYRVTGHGLVFVEQSRLTSNSAQDFCDAARWGLAENGADHVMMVLSNHGYGILDPVWNEEQQQWQMSNGVQGFSDVCVVKRTRCEAAVPKRGFMFNVKPRTYLNNQGLMDGLALIKNEFLHGKNIDILAFDTCMGDMLEVAYEVAPFVSYFVGNQSCSLRDGFDYTGIIPLLNGGLRPRDLVSGMVGAFDRYYDQHDDSGVYTHAAVDLSQVYAVTEALDAVVDAILTFPHAQEIVLAARDGAPRFCMWPIYTDPVAFCTAVEAIVAELPVSPEGNHFMEAAHHLYATVESFVVARCGGCMTMGKAFGCAIYLPDDASIDASYLTTPFAQKTRWIELLKLLGA